MTKQTINIGSGELAGNGESIRSAFSKINDNFDEIYAGGIGGGGSGYTGSQGDIGYTGSSGDIGFTGSQGDIGYTGSSGDIGFTGSQGDIGYTGSSGDIGFTGSQGDIGYTGSQGDIGYTGSSGDIGFTGSQGDIGYSGSVGATPDFSAVAEHIIPAADLTYDLGTTSSQWRSLYVGTSTIYLGGTALSVSGGSITVDGSPVSVSTLVNGTSTVTLSSNGELTFPDGTVQTTAYSTSAPLFVVINDSGETASSSDGETWTQHGQFEYEAQPLELDHVAVGANFVVYIGGNDNTPNTRTLLWASEPGVDPEPVTITGAGEGEYRWYDVERGGNYVVAVGDYDTGEGNVPVFAYTTNGSTWTLGNVDAGYQAEFGGSEFTSVDYNGTGWLIVAGDDNANAGAFFITSPTDTLDLDTYIMFVDNGLEEMPDFQSVVWTGNNWILMLDSPNVEGGGNSESFVISSGSNPITSSWSQITLTEENETDFFNSSNSGFYEDAGGNGIYMIASGNGQVLWTDDAGDTWNSVVPSPYTVSIDLMSAGDPTHITAFTVTKGGADLAVDDPLADQEKLTFSSSNPSDWNGTYYTKKYGVVTVLSVFSDPNTNWVAQTYSGIDVASMTVDFVINEFGEVTPTIVSNGGLYFPFDYSFTVLGSTFGGTDGLDDMVLKINSFDEDYIIYRLYVDQARTISVDSSEFETFVSATATLNRGTYIDAVGFGLDQFLIGNDDEELYVSTNLTDWIKVDDQDNGFNYWNDISFNAEFGSNQLNTGNFTFNADTITNANGMTLVTDRGTLAIGTDMEVPGVPTHFHIAFEGSNLEPASSDLFLGDDFNYVKLNSGAGGIEIGTNNRFNPGQNTWEFGTDGTTTFPIGGNIILSGDIVQVADENLRIQVKDADNDDYRLDLMVVDDLDATLTRIVVARNGVEIITDSTGTGHVWNFRTDGSLTLPGALISATDSPAQGTFPVGAATAITVTNSPNVNWTNGTGVFANGINFGVSVDGSGNATVSSISDGGTGHYIGETFGPVVGTAFGGTSPADDMYFEVTAIDLGSVTALDLNKQTQILTAVGSAGAYSLADGIEGQIMYFVPASGITNDVYVYIDNARVMGEGPEEQADYSWTPFSGETAAPTTIAMAIFADGAWCLRGGVSD